jgi:hypothetical protein
MEPRPAVAYKFGSVEDQQLTRAFSEYATRPAPPRAPLSTATREFLIHIDSGARNPEQDPLRSSFRYELPSSLRNVVSAELLAVCIPNIMGIAQREPYYILDLGDLNGWEGGTGRTSCFAVVYTCSPIHFDATVPVSADANAPNGLLYADKKIAERIPVVYYPSKGQVASIRVTLRDRNGVPVDLGRDDSQADLAARGNCQWSVCLKVTCSMVPVVDSQLFGT